MDKETFLSRITEIGTCEDDVRRRELLAELQNESTSLFDRNSELEASNRQFSDDNEKLRSANMKLFLQVGDHKTPEYEPKEEQKKREFKDLFNEKGMLI